MKKVVVIPTYCSRPTPESWQEGDSLYDHPTPINEKGTLARTLESMKILTKSDFQLALLVCPTCGEVEGQAIEKVQQIVAQVGLAVETYVFSSGVLQNIAEGFSQSDVVKETLPKLSFRGYPNVRNICLLAAELLCAEAAILIDDDEVFEQEDFLERAVASLRSQVNGEDVRAVAGYYLNNHGTYYDDVVIQPWMTHWDRFTCKARAFDQIIGTEPRLKRTPFAFGGAMVIHQDLYRQVPFDPQLTRGEDIDYLINCAMFGVPFFLDNTLSIKHLPEPKNHPEWRRVREDIFRFVYQKAKIDAQVKTKGMALVRPEDFNPYPGEFLQDDLEEKIYRSNMMLSAAYLVEGQPESSAEALKNIYLGKYEAPPSFDPFIRYCDWQSLWEQFMKELGPDEPIKTSVTAGFRES